jgi:hypothetical protein
VLTYYSSLVFLYSHLFDFDHFVGAASVHDAARAVHDDYDVEQLLQLYGSQHLKLLDST